MNDILYKKTKNRIKQDLEKKLQVDKKILEYKFTKIQCSKKKLTQYQIKIINEKLPILIEILFTKEYNNIRISLLEKIIKIFCNSIINENGIENYQLTIGLGASENYPSIRMPAYIIPAINIIKKIIDSNLDLGIPKIRIFKANYAGIYANGFDEKKVLDVSEKTFIFLENFILEFYPDLFQYFIFENDMPYFNTNIFNNITELASIIEKAESNLKAVKKIKKKGEKYGKNKGETNALFYAATHSIYNKAIDFNNEISDIIFENKKNKPDLIIDIGGKSQKEFNTITHYLIDTLNSNKYKKRPLISSIVNVGKSPVYYKANNNDILINEYCEKIQRKMFFDLKIICKNIYETDYHRFLNNFRKNNFV
jgi:hypothetical protein